MNLTRTLGVTAFTLALTAGVGMTLAEAAPVAGKDYRVLPTPGVVEKPGMIEVREFFWYGCPHCYKLEPYVSAWAKTKPSDVNFVLTPGAMNPLWEQSARGFYTVQMLGKLAQTHEALFNTIHQGGQRIFTQADQAAFYSRYGINPTQFNGLFNSFAVTGKVNQAKQLAMTYKLTGVPAIVVNGKYVVQGEGPQVVETVKYLVDMERAKMPKAPAAKPIVRKAA